MATFNSKLLILIKVFMGKRKKKHLFKTVKFIIKLKFYNIYNLFKIYSAKYFYLLAQINRRLYLIENF